MATKCYDLESARDKADNLYHLIDLMYSNLNEMDTDKINALTGLCLDLSCQISSWLDAEFEKREK